MTTKMGVAIGVISRGTVPLVWAKRLREVTQTIPGGMFWDIVTVEGKSWADGRIGVVEKARKRNFEWLFFWDDDVLPPIDIIQTLLSRNKDIVTGIYWTKTEKSTPVVFKDFG